MRTLDGIAGGMFADVRENSGREKNYIAKLAGEIFFAKGFKESSLQDVSIKGNISKAGIYHYFKAKEDILSYILFQNTDDGIRALNESLIKSKEGQASPRESLRELIKTYAAHLLKNRKTSLLVLRERHQLSGKSRKILREKERTLFMLLRDQLLGVLDINRTVDPSLITFHILSSIHWMGYWFDEKGPLSKSEAIDQTIDIICNGILSK